MPPDWTTTLIGGATLAIAVGGIVWKLAIHIGAVRDDLAKAVERLKDDMIKLEKAAEDQILDRAHEIENRFGENITAIRQKVHEMEIWNRDNFINRAMFTEVTAGIKTDIKELRIDANQRWNSIEDKLETLLRK